MKYGPTLHPHSRQLINAVRGMSMGQPPQKESQAAFLFQHQKSFSEPSIVVKH